MGLAVLSVTGWRFGLDAAWPSLLVIAVIVALYNAAFRWSLARSTDRIYRTLRNCATRQMALDLAALLVVIHFTGGIESPLVFFLPFHMAIGAIMVSPRRMFAIAAGTSLATTLLVSAHLGGWFTHQEIVRGPNIIDIRWLSVSSVVLGLFFIVYATSTITERFRERGIRLYRTSAELKALSEEQQQLLAQMRAVEESKAHYMRISAHQLRSPLGTIKTSLQVLLDGYVDPATDRGRAMLRGASERTDQLLETVNGLLELAKMREGRAKAPWSRDVLINQLLADIVDAVEPQAEERRIAIETEIDGVAALAWGIPPDLVHCFENLIHNAIKYSRDGGRVRIGMRVDEGDVVVTVQDEGIGIPADLLDRVFLEFVRAPNAKRHAKEGTGLGLAIAREAVSEHGGTILGESREGEGSLFTVTLPLGRIPPEVLVSLHAGNPRGYDGDTNLPGRG